MAFGGVKAFFGEIRNLVKLQDRTPAITFYAEDRISHLVLGGYLKELLRDSDFPVDYVTSESEDSTVFSSSDRLRVLTLKTLAHQYLAKSTAPLLVMTMPDLGSLHVARPAPPTRCVYVFHALVSVHRQYRADAFDHYDDLFCVGEHHVTELTRRFALLGRPCPALHRVGYHKLDRIIEAHQIYQKSWTDRPTILIAPSWHPENLLESCGERLVKTLLDKDIRVVVRPHPAFFTSIYKEGREIIARYETTFSSHPNFSLERQMDSEESFHEADLLVTDWSGSAYEYAFGTERPVLFIDTPAKVRNVGWEEYELEPFEVRLRPQVGQTLPPNKLDCLAGMVDEMLASGPQYREQLVQLRAKNVFEVGRSAQVGAEILESLYRKSLTG